MSNTQTGAWIAVAIVIAIIVILASSQLSEKYYAAGADYRYGFVDTNPARRTGQFFDTCSPENMEDCTRNNPYEGLPLP
jgi:hypothetical protein